MWGVGAWAHGAAAVTGPDAFSVHDGPVTAVGRTCDGARPDRRGGRPDPAGVPGGKGSGRAVLGSGRRDTDREGRGRAGAEPMRSGC